MEDLFRSPKISENGQNRIKRPLKIIYSAFSFVVFYIIVRYRIYGPPYYTAVKRGTLTVKQERDWRPLR